MKLITITLKCILTWLSVLGILLLLSSAGLRLRFNEAVKMAKPDYEYVIRPDDQKKVNRYIIEREKYALSAFIASLVISQIAVILASTQKTPGNPSTIRPTEPPEVGPVA